MPTAAAPPWPGSGAPRHSAIRLLPALALALLLALTGCASARQVGTAQRSASPPARPAGGVAHIAVIVMENEEYGDIIGARQMPYLNSLARSGALATQMYAITHPSLPNYLALTGGATFGISSDCSDCSVAGSGLGGQLSAHGVSWRAYMEGLPHPCYTGDSAGEYAKKHDPFVYFRALVRNPGLCNRVVPFDRLAADERSARLPRFVWITPNLCDDMHDCGLATGDRFLRRTVPALLHALGPRGLLFITFDEGSSDDGCCRLASGGHIATVLAGGAVRPGARLNSPVDHFSLLQTVEDLLGVPRMRGAACACTPSLAPLLR